MAFYENNKQSTFPGSIDSFITKIDAVTIPAGTPDTGEWVMGGHINALQNSIIKIESVLGTNPQGGFDTVDKRISSILGGFSILTRCGFYSGSPKKARRTTGSWSSIEDTYRFFKTYNYLFYDGSAASYGTDIVDLKNNCNLSFSIKMTRDEASNDILGTDINPWKNLGINRCYVEFTNLVAGDITLLNAFIDHVHARNVELDLFIAPDVSNTFVAGVLASSIHLLATDGIFIKDYTGDTATIKNLSEMLISAKTNYSCRTGALSYLENGQTLLQEYFLGLGLSYIYRFDYYGITATESGVPKVEDLTLLPYFPLNISYLESENEHITDGNIISRVIDNYEINVDLDTGLFTSNTLKIPSSFIYWDSGTQIPGTVITAGTLLDSAFLDGAISWGKIDSASIDGSDIAIAINADVAAMIDYNHITGLTSLINDQFTNGSFILNVNSIYADYGQFSTIVVGQYNISDLLLGDYIGITSGTDPAFNPLRLWAGTALPDNNAPLRIYKDGSFQLGTRLSYNGATDELILNGSLAFVYNVIEANASTSWVIQHNRNCYPSVTIIDGETLEQVFSDIIYDSLNQLTITFSSNSWGTAYII